MVVQKKVTNIPKTKIKKSLKDGESSHKNLAGPREAIAMEVLHMMFMKKLAQNSNFIAFQNKKNYVCLRGAQCPVTINTRKKCPACR